MSKNFPLINTFVLFLLSILSADAVATADCGGRINNPVSDVCWNCMFPISIGPAKLSALGQVDNSDPPPPLVCACPTPLPPYIRWGVGVSYWEPTYITEVVRTPFCSPSLGGTSIGGGSGRRNSNHSGNSQSELATFHVHWFQYPILAEIFEDEAQDLCMHPTPFQMSYMSEFDVTWQDDQSAFLFNPEVTLFANPVAQAACIADALKAQTTMFGIDTLFWCSGGQGSVYPFTGNISMNDSNIDSSLAAVHRHYAKMHRLFQAYDYSTTAAICAPIPQPIIRKQQYKAQMMYPIPQTKLGLGFGVPSYWWSMGREYPYKGEDFSYLIWRKRQCCAF